jgi:hypothetical protein
MAHDFDKLVNCWAKVGGGLRLASRLSGSSSDSNAPAVHMQYCPR